MDRDDAGMSDRSDEARQGDTGMIGSESEEPGPGRDTSLTDPDPVAAGTDQPRATVAMSEGDPMRTRLGSHIEGAGVIGGDVAASEEGATQETPADGRPGYESERPAGDVALTAAPGAATAPVAGERDPGLAAEPVVDQRSYGQGPGVAAAGERVEDVGPSDSAVFADDPAAPEPPAFATEDAGATDRSAIADDPARFGAGDAAAGYEGEPGGASAAGYESEPSGTGAAGYEGEPGGAGMAGYQEGSGEDVPSTYTGEEADVTGRPEYADRAEGGGDQALYQEEPQRVDRAGGGGSLFTDEEPERLDRPGPQEPGVQEGIYDQEADRAREQRPSDGL